MRRSKRRKRVLDLIGQEYDNSDFVIKRTKNGREFVQEKRPRRDTN